MAATQPQTPSLADLDALLPEGVPRVPGPAPRPPDDFDDGYVLPAHSDKPLQELHTHPNDKRLVFYEEPHVYTVDGVPTSTSVTALAHQFEEKFDAANAISLMKSSASQAWPRLAYVHDAREGEDSWAPGRGALLEAGGKTVAAVQPHVLPAHATLANVRALLPLSAPRGVPEGVEVVFHSFARECTDDEIADGWKRKGQRASHLGTEGHWLCECFTNGLPVRWWEPELRVFFDFARTHLLPRGIVMWNTEKEIVCPDADLAGSIDAIVYEPSTGRHHIVDYKRSDKLQADLRGYRKMAAPFAHLDDCKGASYALQVGIYQWVLEREYGMTIGDRMLLSIHPEKPFATGMPYLRDEVEYVMRTRMALVAARRAVAADAPDRFACALSGAPLVDAVRLTDGPHAGAWAMQKAALVAKAAHDDALVDAAGDATDVAKTREAFEGAVAARLAPVAPLPKCARWRARVPEAGLPPFS